MTGPEPRRGWARGSNQYVKRPDGGTGGTGSGSGRARTEADIDLPIPEEPDLDQRAPDEADADQMRQLEDLGVTWRSFDVDPIKHSEVE